MRRGWLCLIAAGVLAASAVVAFAVDAQRKATAQAEAEILPYVYAPKIPGAEFHSSRTLVSEFQAWLRKQEVKDQQRAAWDTAITNVWTLDSRLTVRTSLAPDRSAVAPATYLCSVAKDFMSANPQLGLRTVGVTGSDGGELTGGAIDRSCEIRPHLFDRL